MTIFTNILSLVGPIQPPPGIINYMNAAGNQGAVPGLVQFGTNIIRLMIVIGGLYAFINIILAGYQFMSAGGDSKQIEKAFGKIWQSLIGLLLVAGSFVLAAIFGYLLFQDPGFILKPKIYSPTP